MDTYDREGWALETPHEGEAASELCAPDTIAPAPFFVADAAIAAEAGARLSRERPNASALYGITRAQRIIGLALLTASGVFAAAAPDAASLTVLSLIAVASVTLASFRIAAGLSPHRAEPGLEHAIDDDAELPTYTIIAPVYREAHMLAGLITGFEALDYPADKLEVLVMVEADDGATCAAARRLRTRLNMRIIAAPPGAPRTKPRALNIALAHARGALVTIYDAEDRPHPMQLRAAASAFANGDARLACVQAPLGWYNARETWLTRQFALEYAAQFHVVLPALARWGWPLPLGGTSNHFRASALRAVGGWDPHNVTEDADLGFRLAADGWTSDVITPPTAEEAVTSFAAWTRQRTRWIKGFAQTWLVHMRDPRPRGRKGWTALACLQLTIGLSVAASVAHVPLAFGLVWLTLRSLLAGEAAPFPLTAAFLATLSFTASAGVAVLGARRAGVGDLAVHVLSAPLYWLLHTPAAWRALWSLARSPFHWEKTTHGVSRLASPHAP